MAQSEFLGIIPIGVGFTEAQAAAATNTAFQALASCNSGEQDPPIIYPLMTWYRVDTAKFHMRNPSNTVSAEIGEWSGDGFIPYIDGVPPGTAALLDAGTDPGNVVALDVSGKLPGVDASNLLNVPSGIRVGQILPMAAADGIPDPGYLPVVGGTLGNAASGATYAGSGYFALFEWYWNRQTRGLCPLYDMAGNPVAAGLSATVDWQVNRRVRMLDWRGASPIGADGGAGRISDAQANTIGVVIGVEKRAIAQANLPAVSLSGETNDSGAHSHGGGVTVAWMGSPETNQYLGWNVAGAGYTDVGGTHRHAFTLPPLGSGTPFSVLQPSAVCLWQQKY